MGSDKTCRFCKGTGVIICTTGKDGEMAVACSCRGDKIEKKDTSGKKIGIAVVHAGVF